MQNARIERLVLGQQHQMIRSRISNQFIQIAHLLISWLKSSFLRTSNKTILMTLHLASQVDSDTMTDLLANTALIFLLCFKFYQSRASPRLAVLLNEIQQFSTDNDIPFDLKLNDFSKKELKLTFQVDLTVPIALDFNQFISPLYRVYYLDDQIIRHIRQQLPSSIQNCYFDIGEASHLMIYVKGLVNIFKNFLNGREILKLFLTIFVHLKLDQCVEIMQLTDFLKRQERPIDNHSTQLRFSQLDPPLRKLVRLN